MTVLCGSSRYPELDEKHSILQKIQMMHVLDSLDFRENHPDGSDAELASERCIIHHRHWQHTSGDIQVISKSIRSTVNSIRLSGVSIDCLRQPSEATVCSNCLWERTATIRNNCLRQLSPTTGGCPV